MPPKRGGCGAVKIGGPNSGRNKIFMEGTAATMNFLASALHVHDTGSSARS